MRLRYTAWLVLTLMTGTLAGCNNFTATNQAISESGAAQTGAIAQPGPIAQSEQPSAPIAQPGAVAQSGAIAQSGLIAQSEPPPIAQSGTIAPSGAIAPSGPTAQQPSAPIAQPGTVAPSGAIAPSGSTAQSEPPSAPDPSYQKWIADHVKATFKDYVTYEAFEISTPRWIHSFQGWDWLVCVRFVDRGRRRSYALTFNDTKVVEGHYAYQTDKCGTESYVVFEQMGGLGLPPLH